jgi:VWFA-related protein
LFIDVEREVAMNHGRRGVMTVGALFLLAAAGLLWAQAADEKPAGVKPKAAPLVVRLGVDLVQVDAVVTDKKGRHVTDLKAEDFEVLQDGKPREITHCEYVVAAPEPTAAAPARPVAPADAPPPPAFTALRREDVRRVMAFVMDDYNLSADGIHRVAEGLDKVIRQDLRHGDLIAIMRTSGGMGILHQFTNDRRVLEAAVRDLRQRMPGMGLGEDRTVTGGNAMRDAYVAEAAFLAVRNVLDALRTLPGRKSVVLFSERLKVLNNEFFDDVDAVDRVEERMLDALREVTDLANRSSTVLYTVDPRGPNADIGIGAADPRANSDMAGSNMVMGPDWQTRVSSRRDERIESQTGMRMLAGETGGLFLQANHIDSAVFDIQEDQKGYYVLGYVPDETTFIAEERGPAFRKLQVKVKRPGLRARSRAGFAGTPDTPVETFVPVDRQQTLVQAMVSPFAANTLPTRLTPVFGHSPQDGYVVRAYVHLDASAIDFREVGDHLEAKLEMATAVFGEKGRMLPPMNRDVTMTVRPANLAMVREVGIVLEINVPVSQPGGYQMRVALRDAASARLGSASQFVAVPDLGKRRLALSGVVLGTVNARNAQVPAADVAVRAASRVSPAVRRFAPGADVSYGFAVYHPHVDGAGKPQLTSRVRLVRQGKAVLDQDLSAVQVMQRLDAAGDAKSKAMPGFIVAGTFALPKDLEPGEYAVQVAVVDASAAKDDAKSAGQWTSLEVAAP